MAIKIVDKADTYELVYKEDGVPDDKCSVFILRKLSAKDVNDITDQVTATDGTGKDAKFRFLGGTSTRMKIQKAVVGWRNVTDGNGKEVPCIGDMKDLLPADIQTWLSDHIDEVNGLKGIPEEERKNL